MLKHVITIMPGIFVFFSCAHQQVSYKKDVTPILAGQCIDCHTAPDGSGYQKTGLDMESYDTLMLGTYYGPVILAGDSRRSIFNKLAESRAGELQRILHSQGKEISEEDIEILKLWVDQGALNN